MKKIFALVALIATLVATSCSKDDNDNGISGGTAYSGELLGSWEKNYSDEFTLKWTFNNDGSFSAYYTDDEEWEQDLGLFYVNDDILAVTYIKWKDVDGTFDYKEYDGDYYTEYYYIVDSTSEYIEIECFEGQDGAVDWVYAEEELTEIGGSISSGDIFYKK